MSRDAQNQAKDAVKNQNQHAADYTRNANDVFSTLDPQLKAEATAPQGYGANDLAAANTAVGQSTGGATAGAVGQAGLMAARTGNRGGFQSALGESAREGGRTNADAALKIQGANADLKQKQQQAGIQGLQGLYGTNVNATLGAMGLTPGTINAETNAGNSGWLQNTMGVLGTLSQGAQGAGSLMTGLGKNGAGLIG